MKLLSASYLLPITEEPIREGAVVIDQERIVAVGGRKELLKKFPHADHEDYGSAVLMPGLVNTRTHLELLSLHPGSETFLDWLFLRILKSQQLTPIERRDNVEEGLKQLLRGGITCMGDVGRYTGSLEQFLKSPLRVTLFAEILTSTHPSTTENYQSVMATVDVILSKGTKRLRGGLAPLSAYTLSRNLLKIIASQAEGYQIPVQLRAAESFAEMQFFYESSGEIIEKLFPKLGWADSLPPLHRKTPIQFLDSIGFLANAPILIGCLHLSDGDFQTLKKRGCKIVWSPRIQKRFKLGETPIKKLKKLKIPIGLGTDGAPTLSIWDEMREGLKLTSPEELLAMATLGGASVLGLEKEIGSLEPGKRGDLIALRLPSSMKPAKLTSYLVEQTTEGEVISVLIDGKKITC